MDYTQLLNTSTPFDDMKLQMFIIVGHMFKKKSEKHVDDPMDDDLK